MFFNPLVEDKPFDWRNQTPPIIDHYPEGPGYTRPSNPPFIFNPRQDPTLPLPNPTPRQVDPREVFDPFGFPGGLAGRYMGMGMGGGPIWAGALGGLIGAGINFFGRRGRKK
jgi:hypothetical protein